MLHQQSDQRTDNSGQTFHQQQILAKILQQLTESLKLEKKTLRLTLRETFPLMNDPVAKLH